MTDETGQQQQAAQGGDGPDGTKGTNGTPHEPSPEGGAGEKTLTQAEVNAIVAREKAAWKKAADDERKKAEMTEADRLKAEKQEAETKAAESAKAANARIVRTEARAALADAGVKAERRDYALRMLDLGSVEVNESGDVDSKQLNEAVTKLLADIPELKGATGTAAAGSEMNGGGTQVDLATVDMETFARQWQEKNKRT